MRRVAWLLALLALAGCKREDMYTQQVSRTWDRNAFFGNDTSMRDPVAGTVARHAPALSAAPPTVIDAALLARGQERFDIFCSACHGRDGYGEGIIVQRGFPPPPSFHSPRLRDAPVGHFFDVITHGYGVMYPFGSRIAPADRWAIISYIRALQLSQNATASQVEASDLQQLGSAK